MSRCLIFCKKEVDVVIQRGVVGQGNKSQGVPSSTPDSHSGTLLSLDLSLLRLYW